MQVAFLFDAVFRGYLQDDWFLLSFNGLAPFGTRPDNGWSADLVLLAFDKDKPSSEGLLVSSIIKEE